MRGSDPAASLSSSTTRPQDLTRSPAPSSPTSPPCARRPEPPTSTCSTPKKSPRMAPGRPSHPPGTTPNHPKEGETPARGHLAAKPAHSRQLAAGDPAQMHTRSPRTPPRPGPSPPPSRYRAPGPPRGRSAHFRPDPRENEAHRCPVLDFLTPRRPPTPGKRNAGKAATGSRRPWTARIHATATAAELRDAAPRVRGSRPGRPGSGNRHPRKRDSGYSRRDRLQREYSTQQLLSLAPPG